MSNKFKIKNLLSVEDAKNLNKETVFDFYKKYISNSQVNFFKKFAFGQDLIIKSSGSHLYTKEKKF